MKLIVWLGNPWEKYIHTRHNLGFLFIDTLREKHGFSQWKYESKFLADISEGELSGEKVLLVKPQTFMNLSGESIQKIVHFYKLSPKDFKVVYDDMSMDFGKIRLRDKWSAGWHNGVKSIITYFWDNWKRIKVGIGFNEKYEVSDWVLSKFTEDELIDIETSIYEKIEESIMSSPTSQSPQSQAPSLDSKKQSKSLYCIWIGGIGVSALARYYLSLWWKVYGSDSNNSELIQKLKEEWCDIITWVDSSRISKKINLVIYTEAIPKTHIERLKARDLKIRSLKYNTALGEVVNAYKLIAITGTHGKSTTSSLVSLVLKNSQENFKSIVGTLLKEFDGRNFYSSPTNSLSKKAPVKNDTYFVIEACEYKEHFLEYTPTLAAITNIEYDHADYFQNTQDYIKAYEKFINKILPGGFCIINMQDNISHRLLWKRKDINYIEIYANEFILWEQAYPFPNIHMKVPGEHILFDAKIAYIIGHMIGISDEKIIHTLENYTGVWRRMEIIWTTDNKNILMSDYGHHPTEVALTLKALKQWYPKKKIYTVFQPHQYSRTIELLNTFKECFFDTDYLIISDIYESRDSEEDKKKMNAEILISEINHPNKLNGNWLDNTLKLIQKYDQENSDSSIILLLWAGNIDTLRYKIKTR